MSAQRFTGGKGVLVWDFDGTLGFRAGGWMAALKSALAALAIDPSPNEGTLRYALASGFPWHEPETRYVPRSSTEWWSRLAANISFRLWDESAFGRHRPNAEDFGNALATEYLRRECWESYGDSKKTLGTLRALGWSHFMLSNHVPELREILAHLGLLEFFELIHNSADTGYNKPNRNAFLGILRHSRDPDATVMIGDNPHVDILGARQCGMKAILVRSDHPELPFVSGLEELTDALQGLIAANG